ncbi:hypothetical protein IHQ71_15365 [Rhizobium sp. TH2]|uniref:hypothetical protein n=1 Tax=Rhizobium sp. TH2 TaxID=2775403 RepID=UPI00215893BC|nr:hypothetical protein [Rhizobium sp. TH2]UVC06643.1 hypothetical protein IHQ71_15365 [Rhizobium sp. TH2]
MIKAHVSKGLLRLMVRLPAIRGELQIIHGRDELIRDLTEAYGDAIETLAGLQSNPVSQRGLIREYETICADIEEEIVRRCAAWRL